MSHKCAYIFLGPPGAGKGTLSHECVKRLGWLQLSTGDLFRKHQAEGTELGKRIDFAMKSGTLVDDTLVIAVVLEWLTSHIEKSDGFLFDGFPRTVVQARLFLDVIHKTLPEMSLKVVQLVIDDKEVIERMVSRRVCSNKDCQAVYSIRIESLKALVDAVCNACGSLLIQREDDTLQVICSRLATYHRHSQVLINFFEKNGIVIKKINAEQSFEKVFEKFVVITEEQL